MFLHIEHEPGQGNSAQGISVHLDMRTKRRIEEVLKELRASGRTSQTLHLKPAKFSDEDYKIALQALWFVIGEDGGQRMWDAIEDVAKQAFLVGVMCGQNGTFTLPAKRDCKGRQA